ncbi:MAG: hypothetical protein HS113_08140 [Verrucomicrobiales bacterium]|nr:hypothetical protein [Verrucomicrobiales bacterium]
MLPRLLRRGGLLGMIGVAAALTWAWRPAPVSAEAGPELARLAAGLVARDSLYHRTVGRRTATYAPGLANRFPRLLGVESRAPRWRLEACHGLVALGTNARPVLPQLIGAFCHPEHDIRAYAFIVLVHVGVTATEVVAGVERRSKDPAVQARHCAGLLGDEDEAVREFAWACLESFDRQHLPDPQVVEEWARQHHDPAGARRAARLLARWASGGEPGGLRE